MNEGDRLPVPIPPTTALSEPPIMPAFTTDGFGGPCGAMLGKYRHPNPSAFMSNSTNAGVIEAPWRRTSRGVVMETKHLTLVSGTAPPFLFVCLLSDVVTRLEELLVSMTDCTE